jgi:hypothetical protein
MQRNQESNEIRNKYLFLLFVKHRFETFFKRAVKIFIFI